MKSVQRLRFPLKTRGGILLLIGCFSGLIVWWGHTHYGANFFTPEGLQSILAKAGIFAPLIYIGILAISVIISQIPGLPLVIAAGAIWNPIDATFYSVLGGFLGALIAYFLGKTLGREALKALTGKVFYLPKERGDIYLGWFIFLSRLIPLFSFDLISYGAGMIGVSLPIYALSTLVGMIPPTFLFTYMGSTLTMGLFSQLGLMTLLLLCSLGLPWLIHLSKKFDHQNRI